MRTFLVAATGLPTILFTAALVVVVCFWLLVAVGAAGTDSFDTDVDLDAWGMGGVPVTVVFSLLTALAWLFGLGAAILLGAFVPEGVTGGLLRLATPFGALLAAWGLTRLFVRPLQRFFRDEPAPPRPAEAEPCHLVANPTAPHSARGASASGGK